MVCLLTIYLSYNLTQSALFVFTEEADKKAPLHSTSDTVHRTDWLSNSSFHSEDALSVHQLQKNGDGKKE